MANTQHVRVVRQGAAAIAEWRQQNPNTRFNLNWARLSTVSLKEADLSGADLIMADLSGANLADADLNRASLGFANLSGADGSGANFSGSDLILANLYETNLAGANLKEAYLAGAILTRVNLRDTDFAGSRAGLGLFGGCDLSLAAGLLSVRHESPSSIGVDTLIRSFRGAGNKLTCGQRWSALHLSCDVEHHGEPNTM